MVCICCADKFVIGRIHQIPDIFYLSGNIVHKRFRRYAGFLSLDLNFLSMLVSTGLEAHIIAFHPLKAGNTVGQHSLISISNMGFT